MNTTLNRSTINPSIAATRALAKARMGDLEALRYLETRAAMGDLAAQRALAVFHRVESR